MSDKDSGSNDGDDEPQMTEEEIISEVTAKVIEAFKLFDADGNGGQIKSDQLRELLDHCNFKMEDQEMYKIVSELDPSQ